MTWRCELGHENPDNYDEFIGPPAMPFCSCVWEERRKDDVLSLRKKMLRLLGLATLFALVASLSCTENTIFQITGADINDGLVPSVDQAVVQECQLAPSFVTMRVQGELRVQVRTFAARGIEVLVWPVTSSIEGGQIVQILPTPPSAEAAHEIILKAREVGETSLVVRIGSAMCSAAITVRPEEA